MNEPLLNKLPLAQIYRNLYPWTSLSQFVEQIIGTIAYKSPDNSLVALNKPFGVGTYIAQDVNHKKTNTDKLLYDLVGHSRYCMGDALDAITSELNSPQPYQILKGIDRYISGLVLITNDFERHKLNLTRSQATSRINVKPPYGFRAITCGYPVVKSNKITERVGCELVEVDEFGDHKEPIITANPGWSFKGKHKNKELYQVEMLVKQINREKSTSLVELYASKTKWDFVRCYISSKTSFILGDVRFSKRIREVLGKRIQVSAFRSSHNYDDSYEPLAVEMQRALGVRKNSSIPLMLDHHVLRLSNFYKVGREGRDSDLIIRSRHVPLHFAATAKTLNLFDADCDDTSLEDDHIEHSKSDIAA